MQPERQNHPALEAIFDGIRDLPSPPALLTEILADFEDAGVGVSGLVDKINRDQAIVARILRVANSPFFGFSGRIGSVREAVAMLGFNHIRRLVAAAVIMGNFPRREAGFDWIEFWQHSVRAGNCARELAGRAGVNGEIAFTTGLLHDIGRLVLGIFAREHFIKVQQRCVELGEDWLRAERAVLGVDHAEVGAEVARRWNFPSAMRAAILDHHHPQRRRDEPLSDVVYLANLMANELEQGSDGGDIEVSSFLAGEAKFRLGLEAGEVLEVMAVVAAMNAHTSLLLNG